MIERYKRWLRYKLGDRRHIMGLRLTTTWKCNSKCVTCAIWKTPHDKEKDLTVEEIDAFSRSPFLRDVHYITFSGGEPTLRKDLPEIFTALHRNIPQASFNMTTHGMDSERTEDIFRRTIAANPGIHFGTIGISLNGPPEIHDASRGIPGAFDRTMETFRRLKGLVPCSFSFTFYRDNVDQFEWVQRFAKENGTTCYICWTVMNKRFDVEDRDLVFWREGMDRVLNKFVMGLEQYPATPKGIARNAKHLPDGICKGYLYDHIVNRKIMPCFAGSQIVHVAPNGDVYPCNFRLTPDRLLGNLRKTTFDDIWKGISPQILSEIRRGDCMYPNGLCGDSEIYPSVVSSPPAVLPWYLQKAATGAPLVEVRKAQPGRPGREG
jgi:MoaA/NifB/PqqE/SkfB family radical SAM enzyme